MIKAVEHTAQQALRHGFPTMYDGTTAAALAYSSGGRYHIDQDQPGAIMTHDELYDVLHEELNELEGLLNTAEAALRQRRAEQPSSSKQTDLTD